MSVDRAWFLAQAQAYEHAAADSAFPLDRSQLYPCDDRAATEAFDAHYFFADLHLARMILDHSVHAFHLDVGSRLDGLVTHILVGGKRVCHVDLRPPDIKLEGLWFVRDDMRMLASFKDESCESVSSVHAAEHVGLGRYGDEIDARGMEKSMASLARVLEPSGHLYFAVPIGRQRVVFNAHRVASPSWVIETFASHGLTLESFAAVDDEGRFHEEARPSDYESASYSCGMFELSKRGSR